MRILVIEPTRLLGAETVGLSSCDHELIGTSCKGPALAVDISDKASIVSMYCQAGALDAVICMAGTAKCAPLEMRADEGFAFSLANKLMGQITLVRCAPQAVKTGCVAKILQALPHDPDEGLPAVRGAQALRKCVAEDLAGQVVSAAR